MKFLCFIFLFVFTAPAVSAQQKLLVAVQSTQDSVAVFDLATSRLIGQLKTGFFPHELAYDPVSNKAYISDFGLHDYDIRIGRPGSSITIIDPKSCKYLGVIYTTADTTKGNGPHGIKIRPGSKRELFVNVEIGGDSILVYDLDHHNLKRAFPIPKLTHNFIFSQNGNRLWVMSGIDGVSELDPENGRLIRHADFSSPIRGICMGKDFLIASGKNEIFLISKKDLSIKKHFDNLGVGQILYSAITKDERYILCPAVLDNQVLVIDAGSGKVVHRLKTLKTPINIQVDGNFAYVSHAEDNGITRINLRDFSTSTNLHVIGSNGILVIP
jgi:DNA-binding beta-propeller fold protein YncE